MKVSIEIPDWATHVISDLTDMDRKPHAVNAAKISKFTLNLDDDVYFEYAFLDESGQILADPLNTVRASNPWYANASAIIGPNYQEDTHAPPERKAQGVTQRLRPHSEALNETRKIMIYTPQGYEKNPLPVIYIQDGVAYYRIAKLPEILESLIQDKKIRPAHLVFVEPNNRTLEYSYNQDYRAFMTKELLPLVESKLQTTQERILMGASLGGLVSATLALHYPEKFQTVITQSGAFLGTPENPDFYKSKDSWVLEQFKTKEKQALRFYLETGTLEWLTTVNQELRDVLKAKGYDYAYHERNAGHNWVNWHNGLEKALSFALS